MKKLVSVLVSLLILPMCVAVKDDRGLYIEEVPETILEYLEKDYHADYFRSGNLVISHVILDSQEVLKEERIVAEVKILATKPVFQIKNWLNTNDEDKTVDITITWPTRESMKQDFIGIGKTDTFGLSPYTAKDEIVYYVICFGSDEFYLPKDFIAR